MLQTIKYPDQEKRYEFGIIPLVLVLALAAASAVVMGGAYLINTSRENGLLESSRAKLNKNIEDQGIYIDESKVKNSSFDSNVVGTVILSDGSFSAYKVIDGEVTGAGDQFVGTAKISFLSGDQALDNFNDGTIAPFYLKDGTKTVAQIVDKVVADLVLNDSTSYAIKVLQGKIENGKLTGDFVGQTYDSGFIFAGNVDESGNVTHIVVKSGAQKTTEVESVIAKNAISLFGSISGTASNMKVLGISDYKPTGFNKPIYDDEKGTWIFAGGTLNGSVSISPIQGVVNYIQSVAQSISNGNGIYKQIVDQVDQSNGTKSNKEKTATSTDLIDISQIDLSSIDGQVNSNKISDGAVTISKISAANSASNGNCLTYDSSSGQFKWGNCGNGGGGTITAVNAGTGLTGGGTSGVLSLAVSLGTGGGLQATGSGVSLLRNCLTNEILKWDGNSWTCAADAGGAGAGVTTLKVDNLSVVSSATTIDFLGSDFDLTNLPAGEGNLSIDYTNSKITRSDQIQSITGTWTFANGLILGLDTVSDITGSGLSVSAGALTVTGLTTSNFASGNISQWTNNSGYITGNQLISLSGDATGSGNTSIATSIVSGAVTLSKMANLAGNSIIGNNTGSAATPIALTGSQVKTMLGITTSDVSGLGTIATQNANNVSITGGSLSGLTSVSATTFTGSLTGNASSATTAATATTANALANSDSAGQSAITAINSGTAGTINTARLNSAVTTQGNTFNGISQLVKLDASGNLPALNGAALTGFTKSQVGLSLVENVALSTWAGSTNINTIADKTVTLARMADLTTASFLGRNSAGTGVPEVLSVATVKSMLSLGTIATQSAGNVFITGGNISGINSINGATITGGSLSSSAVNGVTTGNILLSTGSYSNPTWLSGLTASHLTAGDFSTKINSGTYSINISGSAGSASTATTATNITGVLGASSFPAMTGDVTNTQGSLTTAIGSGVVTLGKMANLAANSIIGNNTGSAATPVALSASQVKTLLGILTSDVSGLGTIATQSAGNVFITGGQISGLTSINGSTITGGSLSGTAVNGVTTGNILLSTGSYNNPSWITALSPTKVLPDQTGNNGKVLSTNGSTLSWITNSSGVAWGAITGTLTDQSDLNASLSGKLSTGLSSANIFVGNGSGVATGVAITGDIGIGNTGLTTIGNGAVTLSKIANLTANSIIGNNTGSAATPIALSASQVKTLLGILTSDVSGLGTIATQSAGNIFITGGNISGINSINGATITGGSLSSTAVNGVTTGNIILSTGTYADPSWITSLAPSKILPDQTGQNGKVLGTNGSTLSWITNSSGVAWGAITGLLDSQTDLTASLSGKLSKTLTSGSIFVGNGSNVATGVVMSGDIGISNTGLTTIGNGAVTLGKMANLAANSIIGNNTGSAATPVALTASQVKTLLGISTSDVSGLGTIATQSASNVFVTGGNVSGLASINGSTITGGSLSGTAVNGVTTANIILSTGSYSNPSWITALAPSKILPDQTGQNGKVLSTNGSTLSWITNSSGVAWGAITGTLTDQSDLNASLSGKLSTGLASGNIFVGNGSGVATGVAMSGDIGISNTGLTTIGAGAVTLSKMANLAANSIIGNNTGSAATPVALTASQVKTLLGISTSDVSGLGTIATQSAGNVSISGGNISGVVSINGATITGGSLSGTAVNGVTTGNILLSTGSYSNPTWLSGLTASHLTAGDFSTKINSGTYSINVSGSAGSASTASTANALANSDAAGQSAITAINSATVGTINSARIGTLPYISTSLTSANIIVGNGSGIATGVAMSGDITIDNTGATTIGNSKVTLGKIANIANSTILGNNSGSAAAPIALTGSQIKTILGISTSDVTGLGTIATQSAGNVSISGGNISGVYRINGADITGGSLSGTAVNGVTTADIILSTGSYSNPSWITALSPTKVLPDQTGNNGKVLSTNGSTLSWVTNSSGVAWGAITGVLTDQTDLVASLSAKLSTTLTSGSIFVGNASNVATGVVMTGDVGISNTGLTTIGAGAVSLSKMANISTASFLGRNSAGTGVPEVLSASTAKFILGISTSDVSGLGTIATQSAGNVFITGGNMSGLVNVSATTFTGALTGNASTVTGLSVISGKTLTVQKSMTFTAVDDTGVYTFPTGPKTLVATDVSTLSSLTSIGTLSTLTVTGAITGATATNTINGIVVNSGALSSVTTLGLSGAITGATATNTINGIIINSGAVSSVSTLGLSGAIAGATTTNTINGMIINSGAVSGVSTLAATGTTTIGSGGNTFTFNPASGPIYAGTARPTRRISLSPEFAGATLLGDGDNNVGTMTSDNASASGSFKNYYKWTTTQATNQDYDIWVRIPIPTDFAAMAATPTLSIDTYTSNVTTGTITVDTYDTAGTADCSIVPFTPTAATTWQTKTATTCLDTGTYTAGGIMSVRIHMQSPTSGDVRVGNIQFDYLSKY